MRHPAWWGERLRLQTVGSKRAPLRGRSGQGTGTRPVPGYPAGLAVLQSELLTPQFIVALQRQVGNAAVINLLKAVGPPARPAPEMSVQRCLAGCAPGACAAHDEPEGLLGHEELVAPAKTMVQRKPAGTKKKPKVPTLGACTPVQDDLKPSKAWADLQKEYKKSCGSTVEKGWKDLLSGKNPTSAADAKGAIDCVCAYGSAETAALAAKARLAVAGPLSLKVYQHFLDGSGSDWTIDIWDMVTRDAKVRKKIHAAMKSGALTGTLGLNQSDYAIDDFLFAYGAIDCVQWIVKVPLSKRKSTTPVEIKMLDYYEFHPGRMGVSQCAHAACVELVAKGTAKNFWCRGDGLVDWGIIKT